MSLEVIDPIDDINALNAALILNKTEAICKAGAGTLVELAKALDKPPQRISEWVTQRKYRPDADILFKIREWASRKTLQIAMGGKKLQSAYRTAYKEICEKRRVPGAGS